MSETRLTKREEQAFNEGRNAFARGEELVHCKRRSGHLRVMWRRGFEEERKIRQAVVMTDEQIAEARNTRAKLLDWVKEQQVIAAKKEQEERAREIAADAQKKRSPALELWVKTQK